MIIGAPSCGYGFADNPLRSLRVHVESLSRRALQARRAVAVKDTDNAFGVDAAAKLRMQVARRASGDRAPVNARRHLRLDRQRHGRRTSGSATIRASPSPAIGIAPSVRCSPIVSGKRP